jgi:hypothetical protein
MTLGAMNFNQTNSLQRKGTEIAAEFSPVLLP